MSSPYRPIFIEPAPAEPGAGHCPWCHAAVQFNASDRLAVCPTCDATFATSIASVTGADTAGGDQASDTAPPADAAPAVWRRSIVGWLTTALFIAFELMLIVAFYAAVAW
jgi:hypothetical protein